MPVIDFDNGLTENCGLGIGGEQGKKTGRYWGDERGFREEERCADCGGH